MILFAPAFRSNTGCRGRASRGFEQTAARRAQTDLARSRALTNRHQSKSEEHWLRKRAEPDRAGEEQKLGAHPGDNY